MPFFFLYVPAGRSEVQINEGLGFEGGGGVGGGGGNKNR